MADVRLAQRAEQGVANGVHQGIRIRMAVEALGMRNLHATQDQLAPGHKLMDVVTNANMNHGRTIKNFRPGPKNKEPE
jgi:hypothetical protein